MVKNSFSYSSQTLTTGSVSSPTHLWGYSWGLQPTALQQPRCPQRQPGTPQLPPVHPPRGWGCFTEPGSRARPRGCRHQAHQPQTLILAAIAQDDFYPSRSPRHGAHQLRCKQKSRNKASGYVCIKGPNPQFVPSLSEKFINLNYGKQWILQHFGVKFIST